MGKTILEKDKVFSKPKKKRKRTSSSSSTSTSSSSLSSLDEETKKILKRKIKKLRKKEKHKKKKEKKEKKEKKALKKLIKNKLNEEALSVAKSKGVSANPHDVDITLSEKSKSLAPMTKEEWEKQQNTFKRVYDEETGRMRLIRGTGEIVEECVSRERQLAINKQATKGDGEFFQKKLLQQIK